MEQTQKYNSYFSRCLPLLTSILFILLLLTNPVMSSLLVKNGLTVWYRNMIPSLFPFMVLSGFMLRTGLSYRVSELLYPVLGTLFRLSPNCIYVILMGFLCGFPMGANIIAESLSLKKITEREAELLLSFCNNIGPVYFLSFVAIICPYYPVWLTFSVMYLLPLCYGLLLRYIFYRDIPIYNPRCSVIYYNADCPYGCALQESVQKALSAILILGSYMVIFNVLQLPFHNSCYMLPEPYISVLKGLFEISSGISAIQAYPVLYGIVYAVFLPFGGLCCIFQTYAMIKDTPLSLTSYLINKIIQTICSVFIYSLVIFFADRI